MRYVIIIVSMFLALDAFSQEEMDSLVSQECIVSDAETLAHIECQRGDSILSTNSVATTDYDFKHTKEWDKYIALRAVGWSMFGVGVPCFFGGVFYGLVEIIDHNRGSVNIGSIIAWTGLALSLGSIPTLIVAYRNRYKAKHPNLEIGMGAFNVKSLSLDGTCAYSATITLNF